jgi:hypothetical protein
MQQIGVVQELLARVGVFAAYVSLERRLLRDVHDAASQPKVRVHALMLLVEQKIAVLVQLVKVPDGLDDALLVVQRVHGQVERGEALAFDDACASSQHRVVDFLTSYFERYLHGS